jgi:autotransporter-associated beta strand protein
VGSLGGSGDIHLGSGANLSVGTGNLSGVFSGAVAGDAGLIKLGSGSLELARINVYTGSTQVNGGVLNVSGSLASPVVQVNSGHLDRQWPGCRCGQRGRRRPPCSQQRRQPGSRLPGAEQQFEPRSGPGLAATGGSAVTWAAT